MIDLNRTVTKQKVANDAINAAIDAAISARTEKPRDYLGASALGHECLRKIQWDWRKPKGFDPKTRRIFERGHWAESYAVGLMLRAGFRLAQDLPAIAFNQMDGLFRGHGDGIIYSGPAIDGLTYPCLWEHKGLGFKGWNELAKSGLAKAYPAYADQVAVYQAYFDLTGPALFSATNMNTMEMLHLVVPFDAARAQAASDRAVAVIRAVEAGETLPRVAKDPNDFRCRFCNHASECWE